MAGALLNLRKQTLVLVMGPVKLVIVARAGARHAPMERTLMKLQLGWPAGSEEDGAARAKCVSEPLWQGCGPKSGLEAPAAEGLWHFLCGSRH
ncbi:hypothetical protein SRHO_G00259800 [Serrasalmus rhombeus]